MHADARAPSKRALKAELRRMQEGTAKVIALVEDPPERRVVAVNNRHLNELVDEAWAAELACPVGAESLFVRDGRLVRLARGRVGVRLVEVSQAALLNRLVAVASWTRAKPKEDGEGFELKASKPPRDILGMMLEAPHRELPELEAVVSAPVFGSSGKLVARPGYHREDRLWYAADGLRVDVPAKPTPEDVAAAKRMLDDELFVDFPFATPSDRTHAVGALLLPFVRRMVAGPTPLHLIEAATPGTGKSLLADAIGMVVTGDNLKATVFESDEAEVRKKITTLLEGGDPIIYADNIRAGIDSAAWASALTASVWSDRRLGGNTTITAPNNATWIATANNPRVTTEIARRVARIRLVAEATDPEARTGFRHPHLLTWARSHRAELVRAVLVLVRAWQAAGSATGEGTLGSFESWVAVVGGIVQHAGYQDFLLSSRELKALADVEGAEWRAFVSAWWAAHQANEVKVSALLQVVATGHLASIVSSEAADTAKRTKLGRALMRMRDRVFEVDDRTVKLTVTPDRKNSANVYRLASPSDPEHEQERLI